MLCLGFMMKSRGGFCLRKSNFNKRQKAQSTATYVPFFIQKSFQRLEGRKLCIILSP